VQLALNVDGFQLPVSKIKNSEPNHRIISRETSQTVIAQKAMCLFG